MERRLIDMDALLQKLHDAGGCDAPKDSWADGYDSAINLAYKMTQEMPIVDAAEVVHGKWYVSEYEYLSCSICGGAMYTGCDSMKEAQLLKHHWKPYCPQCGAKMDGGENGK